MSDSEVDSELDINEKEVINPEVDDDNFSVMSEVTYGTSKTIHTADMDTLDDDDLKPAGAPVTMQAPLPSIFIPNRKAKMGKNKILLLGYVQDVVKKVTNGIDQEAVIEMIKRKIIDGNGYDLASKFVTYMQSTNWSDMQPVDDKEEDEFLKQMSNLAVSTKFQYEQ